MFPWQVFGLRRFIPTCRTSQSVSLQCHLGLSYLLTAAGQFRTLTGFPFHSPRGETVESPPYLGSVLKSRLFVVDNNPKKVHLAVQHRTLRQIEKYHADIAENRDLLFSVLSHQQNSASIVSTWLPASVAALSGPGTALRSYLIGR